jgi:glycosyltransferase involved in cell wall biosynthesis
MTLPRISVVTPSFNQGQFIRTCIESVIEQDYPNFEHIVVDGGSTDETVPILRTYPHLSWTSEPDEGQSDALNRGFRRATGDIIAWINSDDWYAPGAFKLVVDALRSYPVVMGKCQMTDRDGRPTELVVNAEHSWFDIIKYWIYDSIPTQPSIFFSRSLLEQVRLANGSYLDADLHFVMDFDLWLRMAQIYPFDRRVDQVLSYYRMYESNKTGGDWDMIFKEASRVFARHATSGLERRVCFLVPLVADETAIDRTFDDLARQTMRDFEVLLVGSLSRAAGRVRAASFASRHLELSVRYVQAGDGTAASLLNTALKDARAAIACPLAAGMQLAPDLCLRIANHFAGDSVGAVTASAGGRVGVMSAESVNRAPQAMVNELLGYGRHRPPLAVRLLALAELGGLRTERTQTHGLAELYLRLLYKGWRVIVEPEDQLPQQEPGWRTEGAADSVDGQLAARLIVDLEAEYEAEPFARIRELHAHCVRFPPPLVESARQLLAASRTAPSMPVAR